MSIVAVIGDGASTSAVGLAATWPRGERTVVAELDPAGGCLSAWLDVPRSPSLSELVASSGAGSWPVIESMFQTSARGVDVLVAPTRAIEAAAAVAAAASTVLPVLAALDDPIVLADGGRVRGRLTPLVAAAGVVAVMHRQHAGSASAAAVGLLRVADLCEVLSLRSIPFVVGLVGEQPYRCDEVAAFVGVDLVVPVDIDTWAAAVLAGRAGSQRRLRHSDLFRSLGSLAQLLSTLLRETRRAAVLDESLLFADRGTARAANRPADSPTTEPSDG
ncbi:MAG: hypothetical protein JWM12_651 [Ilumatobacteraceae bacterium]|jgi:hypothetical protein|nr:hypothetical protein [Ilumatobacteraceae bacterium]